MQELVEGAGAVVWGPLTISLGGPGTITALVIITTGVWTTGSPAHP